MSLVGMQEFLGARPELVRVMGALVPGGLAWFDAAGTLVGHNQQLERIVGALPARASDWQLRPMAPRSADGARAAHPLERALAGTAVEAEDVELVRADGSSRWLRLTALPLPEGAGAGALAVVVDVGEHHGLDAVRQQVLGVVAHDLRNPLSALRMTASLLTKPQDMPTNRRVQLGERMLGTIGRTESMVATLLEYARAEAGVPIRLNRERLDLGALLERAKRDLDVLFPSRTVAERRVGSLLGAWDAARIERVLANLLSNALKHGRDDAPVTVELDGRDPVVVKLSVHNTGSPIGADLLPRLFEPFTIGPLGQDGRRRSVGLGLYIVKHLVAAHGGTVSVRSTAQEGTTFSLTLPREPEVSRPASAGAGP
jgi:PAS domain S-box-containing protein